jgi:hypothetical protein
MLPFVDAMMLTGLLNLHFFAYLASLSAVPLTSVVGAPEVPEALASLSMCKAASGSFVPTALPSE